MERQNNNNRSNVNHTNISGAAQQQQQLAPLRNRISNGIWRQDIPRSRSEEDEDVKRAIAESLGEIYIPPPKKTYSTHNQRQSTLHVPSHIPLHINDNNNINQQPFESQEIVTYEQALEMLLEINCCFGLYDKKIKQWRTAVYMKKWDDRKRLMVRFTQEANINPSGSDKFLTIKDFPVDYIILNDWKKYHVTERDLRDKSNVPKENINLLSERRKNKIQILVNGFAKEQTKMHKIGSIPSVLQQIIAHYCFVLLFGEEDVDDWSKRTDFWDVTRIGYLCDDGEVVEGDCLRQKPGKIFVHFPTDAGGYGKKYDWIDIPNERICPPPKNRPKRRTIGFAQEMNTFYDYETSHMPGQNNNNGSNRNNYNRTQYSHNVFGSNNDNNEEDDLQRAIAASLQDVNTNNNNQI